MLSNKFKNIIKDSLKNEYDIDCHRISLIADYGYPCREAVLHCSHQNEKFTLSLMLNVTQGVFEGVIGTFNIIIPEMFSLKIATVNKKINLELIKESLQESRSQMVNLNPMYSVDFEHSSISIINGKYIYHDKAFNIQKIDLNVYSSSRIKVYNSLDSGNVFCRVFILGDKIIIEPESGYDDEPVFKEASMLYPGGMNTFKANLIKSLLIYFEKRYEGDDDFKIPFDNLLSLNYADLQQEFLVIKMQQI